MSVHYVKEIHIIIILLEKKICEKGEHQLVHSIFF